MSALGKHCPRCKTDSPANEFHRDASTADGLSVYCAACRNEMNRMWYEQHRDERAQQIERWKQEHADDVRTADLARKRAAYATDPSYREVIRQRNAEQYARRKAAAQRGSTE